MTDSLWRKRQEPEALKLALEALNSVGSFNPEIWGETDRAITAIKAALEAPQRTWQGLTDEERNDCLVSADPCECLATPEAQQLMEDVETKLKEKNT
jgi:hypothetical protein